jgi:prepilin signal peptidase PulO-like enzyme (type II secretory pathway)
MTIATFFVFGLIIGSFLNVVVYRIRIADTLMGRSYCPHCKGGVAWYDNIPLISFIILKAQCRNCKKKISWQYPLVELFTAVLFAAVGAAFFSALDPTTWLATFYYLVILGSLMVILVYDFLYMEIPGVVLWPAIVFSIGFKLLMDWTKIGNVGSPMDGVTYSGVLAAFLAFAFFFMLVSVSKEKWMGMGDAYLVILLGLIIGWPEIILGLFLAFLFGSVWGLVLIAAKKKNLKSQIPFAPFLILGTIVTLFFYGPIISWYTGLFTLY